MFDIGWSELLVIAAVAIVVVGPKDLPRLLKVVGKYVGKIKRTADDFKSQIDEAINKSELKDLKDSVQKEVDSLKDISPVNDLEKTADDIAKLDAEEKARIQAEKEALEADENLDWDEPDEMIVKNKDGDVIERETGKHTKASGSVDNDYDEGDLLDEEEYDSDAATSREMIQKTKADFEQRMREEAGLPPEEQIATEQPEKPSGNATDSEADTAKHDPEKLDIAPANSSSEHNKKQSETVAPSDSRIAS